MATDTSSAATRADTLQTLKHAVPELSGDMVAALERGVWNWALEEAAHRDHPRVWDDTVRDDYCRRAAHCASNLSRGCLGNGNSYLLGRVLSGEVEAYTVAFLDATQLNAPLLARIVREKETRDTHDRDKFMATSALFECPVCRATRATFHQLQTRSGDEGSTVFLTCMECGNKWTDSP